VAAARHLPTLRESYLLPRFTRAVGGDGSGAFGYLLPTLRVLLLLPQFTHFQHF
jgi:hypothetical protein